MSDASNDQANDLANMPMEISRPGHWFQGMPKTPGSGRQKGTPNKVGPTAQEAARKHTRSAIRNLWKLAMHAEQEMVRLRSTELILAYAHGRPAQVQLVGGTGEPIQSQHLTVEISRRISEVFAEAKAVDPDKPALS